MTTHQFHLDPLPHGTARVSFNGAVLIARTRQPLFDSARLLADMGYPDSDIVETWRPGMSTPAMRWTIGQARLWNATLDAELRRWSPHPRAEKSTPIPPAASPLPVFEIYLDLAFT